MIWGVNSKVLRKLEKFQENTITPRQAKDLLLDNRYEVVEVVATKMDGGAFDRDVYTTVQKQPRGKIYKNRNYRNGNYLIVYSVTNNGWRTVIIDNIKEMTLDGVKYKVRK